MLRSKHLKSSRSAGSIADYFEHKKASEAEAKASAGYYEAKAAPSTWLGQGAKALGLEGRVDREQLIELLEGRLPDGTDLTSRGGRAAQARRGTDLTFSASKSFSVMATADPRLLALWDESVKIAAEDVVEKEIVIARTGHGGSSVEQTGKAVLAAYRHEDTRVLEDGTPDPDLHTHLLAINATQRADGTWVRMDLSFGKQMVLAKTADFAQKAWLACEVQKLGYEIRQTKDGWEFSAIPQEVLDAFSRRSQQIDAALQARGIDPETATDSQKEAACLATRGSKSQASQSDQRWEWRARLREQGLDLDAVVAEAKARGPIATPDLSLEAVRSAARHVGERESVFSNDVTRLEAMKAGMGRVTLETVETAMQDKSAGLIDVGGGKITTREALYREQEILARLRAGRDTLAPLMTREKVSSLIETTEQTQGYSLSEGQKAAIHLALTSPDRVTGIIGAWGVGKTTGAARPIVAQAQALGLQVQAIAPTTQAKREIAGAKADETMTIAAWLLTKPEITTTGAIERNENRLIVMDEAGMVDAATMDAVLRKLDAEGGRLILTGDPERQLRSVGAGKPLQQAMEAGAVQYVEINEVQRQTDSRLKKMAQVWANRDTVAAVQIAKEYMHTVTVTDADWKAAGREPKKPEVVQSDDPQPTKPMVELAEKLGMEDAAGADFETVRKYLDEHSKKQLGYDDRTPEAPAQKIPRDVRQQAIIRETAERYLSKTAEERADLVMMALTNKIRRGINELTREGLKREGAVGEREVKVTALDKVDMSAEKLARPESYAGRTDLVVRMLEGKGKDRHIVDYKVREVVGERVILDGPDGKGKIWSPATAKSPSVYTTRAIALAVGDEVNFRDSSGRRDTPDRIENGEDARIVRLDPAGPVARMGDGREITLRADQNHPLDYGYCRTVHKAQGMSKSSAIYAAESVGAEAISQVAGVACTRAKVALEIVTDDPEKLGKAMEKWAQHKAAIEATKTAHQPDLDTLQSLRMEAQADLGRAGDLSKAREAEPIELAQARRERELAQEMDR